MKNHIRVGLSAESSLNLKFRVDLMSYLLPGVDFMLMYTSFEVSLHYNDTWYVNVRNDEMQTFMHISDSYVSFFEIWRVLCVVYGIGISHFFLH